MTQSKNNEPQKFVVNASCIILDADTLHTDYVLLMRRSQNEDKNSGKWGIPGGKLDITDPSVEDGLSREVREEVGVSVKGLKLFETHIVPEKEKLYMVFAGYTTDAPNISNEAEEVRWVTPLQLVEMKDEDFTPNTRRLLLQFFLQR